MPILYYKQNCLFCRQVLATISRLEIEVDLRDIQADQAHADAVMERGGKLQTPFLVDEERGVALYDADAIIGHLQINYGAIPSNVATRPRVHVGGSVCESCEG